MLGICVCVMIAASAISAFVLTEWSKGRMDGVTARRVGKPALTTALLSFCFTVLAWAADAHLVSHGQFWGFLALVLGCRGLAASWNLHARSESLARDEERVALMHQGAVGVVTGLPGPTAPMLVSEVVTPRFRRLLRDMTPPRPLPSDLWRAAGTVIGLTSLVVTCGSVVLMYLPE